MASAWLANTAAVLYTTRAHQLCDAVDELLCVDSDISIHMLIDYVKVDWLFTY